LRAGGNTFGDQQVFNGQIRLDTSDGFSQSSAGPFFVDAPNILGGRLAVLTDGRVGIGVSSPEQQLSVAAGMNIDHNNGNDAFAEQAYEPQLKLMDRKTLVNG